MEKLEIWADDGEKDVLYYETEVSGLREAREIFREYQEVWEERGIEAWVVNVWAVYIDTDTDETRRL